MKRYPLMLMASLTMLTVGPALWSCSQPEAGTNHPGPMVTEHNGPAHHEEAPMDKGGADKGSADTAGAHAQTHCPVMGDEIKKEYFTDYKGQRVYFCCPGCEADFYKDPERYIKKLEAEGVVLDKPDLGDTKEETK